MRYINWKMPKIKLPKNIKENTKTETKAEQDETEKTMFDKTKKITKRGKENDTDK
ncbi:MAG: hypothetical protein LBQ37_02465 [Elusimicrobiota bacterium]|nr:hypothetical protein [Elusimicrobiota bacterium]